MNLFTRMLLAVVLMLPAATKADEGMWLPILLKQLNEADMQANGLKLSADDIYNINASSLKDAVGIFGGGCTFEVISPQGLILTNHHCGYGVIQSHSSVENDILSNGFWAMNKKEELTNPSLTVTFIVRMEDVTEKVLAGIGSDVSEAERAGIIQQRAQELANEAVAGTHYGASVRPFYYGNEYYLFVTETFRDVRLVGAPPSSIGKFGGETDNWKWPRHNADFSLFRVYSGPDGKPAPYSEENIPLKPRHYFPISLKGANENDFTMVYGFPGSTQEYLTSHGVDMIMNSQDPLRIGLRDQRLKVMKRYMASSDKIRIQYASKYARVANGYKKWKGEIRGLKRDSALKKKRAFEVEFMSRVNANPTWKKKYGDLLSQFEALYQQFSSVNYERFYFIESGYSGIEAVSMANRFTKLDKALELKEEEGIQKEVEALRSQIPGIFKDYHAPIDREVSMALLESTREDLSMNQLPDIFEHIRKKYKNDIGRFVEAMFTKSVVTDAGRMEAFLAKPSLKKLKKDPAIMLNTSLRANYFARVQPTYGQMDAQLDSLYRIYMQAQREVFSEKTFYPDANFTLRVTYGKVQGMEPKDGVNYLHYTTLEGVMAKEDPNNSEFYIPEKLKTLYHAKDFGKYGIDGVMPVCFIASNHTSGGNSGSPVINGEGHLIGLNFDRNWEGTMSDINYDVKQCRNISVDLRYVLFIIDKFADAGYLIEEMKLVE
ncbi:MAG: S46 family peptidase [Bacteroidota bacterium]